MTTPRLIETTGERGALPSRDREFFSATVQVIDSKGARRTKAAAAGLGLPARGGSGDNRGGSAAGRAPSRPVNPLQLKPIDPTAPNLRPG
ncbi:hypothetical protein J5226_09110 [Lysobacter sp. K5869]|uniref:hypothetical protein n=1 Tax=Lysobacter sp. K5869 TaxID=2820808 RepID=UPI001C06085F|nr:hypothetical protein [Lysobacter sp. K5869]QWP78529.1 hypothetical protein J5226_09110 [Lysobacter sp. K5869]